MLYKFFFLSLLLASIASAVQTHDHEETATDCQSEEIQGIVLVGSPAELLKGEKLASSYHLQLYSINLPGSPSRLQAALIPYYVDQPWNEETIRGIKQAVYRYYQDQGHPFVLITIPQQDKKSKVVQLIVEESHLGQIEVVGNRWTPTKRFLRYFKTKPGDPINERRISKDLNFTNRNPFRRVDLIYSAGVQENTTDLTIQVEDRKPYRFYLGFDNTGVPTTGRQRVFAGFSWDQLFDLDHVIFYQYTTNYNANRFHANTFQYMAFLPLEMILNLYGGFSLVHANINSPNKKNKGTNIQGSIRWQMPLLPFRYFSHEVSIGFDIKNTNNTMEFVDFSPTFGQTVNLTQFMAGYQCKWDSRSALMSAGLEIYFSPVEWLPNQSNGDFASLRNGAQNKWVYGTAFYQLQKSLPLSCASTLYMRGQLSNKPLLPSEQLGLGGYDTIRGYDERQYNGDNGLFLTSEFHTPKFSLFGSKKAPRDQMYFLLFLDGGFGFDIISVPDVKKHNFLVGTGPGIRYSYGSYFNARCDWGIKLHQQNDFTGGASMVHFSVNGSY